QPSHEAAREPGTILISAPDSFLDAFCAPMGDADDGGDPGKGGERQHRAKSGAGAQPKSRRSLLRRTWILVGEVRNALAGDDIAQRRHRIRLWVVAGVAIVMVAVPLAMYVTGGTERQIRKLMAEERYAESAALASSHLKNSPGAENVRLLGTESLVRSVAPQWVQSMQAGDRDAAEKVLAQAQEQSEFNQDGLRALALLEWMARVDAFTRDRGGRGAPLEIFRHENEVSDLLQWWEEDSRGHRNLLNRVLNYAPELHPLATESMSQLVALQNESSVYLTAITDLSRTIVSRLGSDAAGELRTVFEDFERRYHAVAGMQRLWMDLERWTAIRDAVEGRDLPLAVRLANQTEFETPPFREAARLHIWPELPPPAIVAEYERAVSAWTNGEWATALATLEELMDRPWGEVAQHRLERYRRVLEEHRALLELSEGPDYGERLLAFYAELHPDEDARFRQGLEEDYQRHRELALAQAGDTFRQASDRWVAYRRNGGIDGLMRLEETVSDLFRAQSSLLSRALSDAEEAMHVYRLLRMDTPVPLHQVHDDIVAEVRRQRQWLEDMHIVLDSSLLEAKLALLPASREVEP
ncbi:MAG: hypothetical protein LAT50_17155, partial [Ectothiorhodospiraceae bacterium]|nr:hypothetical protein [Ectothiorhodospiraceae bacterium]